MLSKCHSALCKRNINFKNTSWTFEWRQLMVLGEVPITEFFWFDCYTISAYTYGMIKVNKNSLSRSYLIMKKSVFKLIAVPIEDIFMYFMRLSNKLAYIQNTSINYFVILYSAILLPFSSWHSAINLMNLLLIPISTHIPILYFPRP